MPMPGNENCTGTIGASILRTDLRVSGRSMKSDRHVFRVDRDGVTEEDEQ